MINPDELRSTELITLDGRPALVLHRRLHHGIDRVWRAVSEPGELAQWFVAAAEWGPTVGERFEAAGASGEILEVDPPRRLAWTFGGDRFSFDLAEADGGCELTFTHVVDDRAGSAQTATGWNGYLRRLQALLDGGHLDELAAHEGWEELHEALAEKFGVDPGPGRQFAEALRRQSTAG